MNPRKQAGRSDVRHTGFDRHVASEEVLPVAPGKSYSDTGDTGESVH